MPTVIHINGHNWITKLLIGKFNYYQLKQLRWGQKGIVIFFLKYVCLRITGKSIFGFQDLK